MKDTIKGCIIFTLIILCYTAMFADKKTQPTRAADCISVSSHGYYLNLECIQELNRIRGY